MKCVYIAGPYRASTPWGIEQNVRVAEIMALDVWKAGYAALCPHTMCRYYQHSATDQVWIDGTMELMKRCDAMIVVGDWEKSSGTRAEIEEARRMYLPLFFDLPTLIRDYPPVQL